MNTTRAISTSYNFSFKFKIAALTILIWGLFISMGSATSIDERQTMPAEDNRSSTSVDKVSNTNSAFAANPKQAELPQDFFAHSSPLSEPSSDVPLSSENVGEASIIQSEGTERQCSSSGDTSNGSESCIQRRADGSFMETHSTHERMGDEKKEQTTINYYQSNGESAGKDTTRIKTSYYSNSEIVQRESYDIVIQPARGLINRDWIIKEYNSQGELKKTIWAHYIEMGTKIAGLAHHAVIYYEDGKLSSGFANQYKRGKVTETLLNYDPHKNPNLRMEKTGILKWTRWIDQLIHQAQPRAF